MFFGLSLICWDVFGLVCCVCCVVAWVELACFVCLRVGRCCMGVCCAGMVFVVCDVCECVDCLCNGYVPGADCYGVGLMVVACC